MASSSSHQLSSTTTAVSAAEVQQQLAKINHQWKMLVRHYFFIHQKDFDRLTQCGLMDQLVKVLDDIDAENQAALEASNKGKCSHEDNLQNDKDEEDDDEDEENEEEE